MEGRREIKKEKREIDKGREGGERMVQNRGIALESPLLVKFPRSQQSSSIRDFLEVHLTTTEWCRLFTAVIFEAKNVMVAPL